MSNLERALEVPPMVHTQHEPTPAYQVIAGAVAGSAIGLTVAYLCLHSKDLVDFLKTQF